MDKIQNKIKSFFSEIQKFFKDERVIFGSISLCLLCFLIIIVIIYFFMKIINGRPRSVFSTTQYKLLD